MAMRRSMDILGDTPPTRVMVALDFLAHLTSKQQCRPVVNHHQIEVIKGQQLTTAEANAQASACNLLNDYFLGKLKPSSHEKFQKELVEDMRYEESPPSGRVIKCFACSMERPPNPDCIFCEGTGGLLVYSIVRGEDE